MVSDRRRFFVLGAVFIALVLASAFAYALAPLRADQRVLFFPTESTGEWQGELRKIPRGQDGEESVVNMLKELLLGPIDLRFGRALPRATQIRSVLLRGKALYIDFSEHLVFDAHIIGRSFEEITDAVEQAVRYNFPSIENVVIAVNGMVAKDG